MPEPKERKASVPEPKEREAKEARSRKEAEEAKQERERREKQAQEEERRRLRERERPKVLPRHGVTAAWPSQVLPEQKREGVTAAWPSKVLLPTRVLPMAGAPFCGAPAPKLAGGKEAASTMAVREPILKELLGYRKAQSEAAKEAHRRKLRELFESLGPSAAQPFQVMLSTQNALAVTFREVLKNDPLQNELLGILGKKFAPDPAQCAPSTPAPAPLSGVTLPVVTLTDEESFDVLHAELEQRITALRAAGSTLTNPNLLGTRKYLLEDLLPALEWLLKNAQKVKVVAFHQGNAAPRVDALKKAGDAYTGALVVSPLLQLATNIAVVTQDANTAGVPVGVRTGRDEDSPLFKLLSDFRNDNAIIALTQAGLDADVPAMHAAWPAGNRAFELHLAGLARWITWLNRGAVLSKKVIQVADILMIAISIHQVAKLPAVPAGGSPTPPTILGTLPGGAAVGSAVSLPSLARALEAIRRLVAIGALDGAVIGGIGSLGGGPSIALPELQRPTSLSVQGPGGSASPTSRVWPKHHPFPKYLGGAPDQTLKKIPKSMHHQFHAALDKWKGGKYARSLGAEHFKDIDRATVIRDLREFYKTAENGAFAKYLDDFEQAVAETLAQ
jgi:hypothetical protein